jgi:uncharacterized protein
MEGLDTSSEATLRSVAGVGFKPEHFDDILSSAPKSAWFEVHAENYMGAGGPPHAMLEKLRRDYSISCHGVGLSIGSMGDLNKEHLGRLAKFCQRYEPTLFSEHLAWSSHSVGFLNDLLPLPYNKGTLDQVIFHIDEVQEAVGRQMLLENPSSYLSFETSDMTEVEFLKEVSIRTGCGLLLDVNNVYISAHNLGYDAHEYLTNFPVTMVGEIHLAGFSKDNNASDGGLLIDDHGSAVADPVWELYQHLMGRIGPVPTLIEWDNNIPSWSELAADMCKANDILAASFPVQEILHVS